MNSITILSVSIKNIQSTKSNEQGSLAKIDCMDTESSSQQFLVINKINYFDYHTSDSQTISVDQLIYKKDRLNWDFFVAITVTEKDHMDMVREVLTILARFVHEQYGIDPCLKIKG